MTSTVYALEIPLRAFQLLTDYSEQVTSVKGPESFPPDRFRFGLTAGIRQRPLLGRNRLLLCAHCGLSHRPNDIGLGGKNHLT